MPEFSTDGAIRGACFGTEAITSDGMNRPSYGEVAKRKFPNITVDLVPDRIEKGARLGYSVVADVIFDHLKLFRTEVLRFQTFKEDNGRQTLKIRTTKDINVRERFGAVSNFEVPDGKQGLLWRASIRGAAERRAAPEEETQKLRIINPPEEASFKEVKEAVEKFAVVKSSIKEEVVSEQEEPRLAGYPTGVLYLRIKKGPTVPQYIMIRRQRVRVHVALPHNVCLRCREEGHRVADCDRPRDRDLGHLGENLEANSPPEDGPETEEENEAFGKRNDEHEEGFGLGPGGERTEEMNGVSLKKPIVVKPVRGGGGPARVRGSRGRRDGLRSNSETPK